MLREQGGKIQRGAIAGRLTIGWAVFCRVVRLSQNVSVGFKRSTADEVVSFLQRSAQPFCGTH
jgi:hypothetical protein